MIIYQVQPNRLYPIITNSLGRKYCNIYTFKHIFKFKSINDEQKAFEKEMIYYQSNELMVRSKKDNNFLNKFYREAFVEDDSNQDIDLVHGIFPNFKLLKNKNDFIFTFLDHPLNQVYNWFYYLNFINKICSKLKNDKVYLESYQGYKYGPQETMIADLFQKNFPTIENYIDNFIDNNGQILCHYNDIEFYFIDEIYHAKSYKEVNFCGLINNEENLFKSIKKLSSFLFVENLDMDKYKTDSKIIKNINYRQDELELLLKEDIEFFYEKEKEILK